MQHKRRNVVCRFESMTETNVMSDHKTVFCVDYSNQIAAMLIVLLKIG